MSRKIVFTLIFGFLLLSGCGQADNTLSALFSKSAPVAREWVTACIEGDVKRAQELQRSISRRPLFLCQELGASDKVLEVIAVEDIGSLIGSSKLDVVIRDKESDAVAVIEVWLANTEKGVKINYYCIVREDSYIRSAIIYRSDRTGCADSLSDILWY